MSREKKYDLQTIVWASGAKENNKAEFVLERSGGYFDNLIEPS